MFSLVSLRLIGHELQELPAEVGENCLSLTSLSLASNAIAALPDSLCELGSLQTLLLHNNQLAVLPHQFGSLRSLEQLTLMSNKLTYLPASFGSLPALTKLSLSRNRIFAHALERRLQFRLGLRFWHKLGRDLNVRRLWWHCF